MSKLKSILLKEVTDYLILRLIIFIVGILFLFIGLSYMYDGGLEYSYKFTLASTGWGVIILVYVIKKQMQIYKNNKNEMR
jgi:hypothetical protein